MRTLEFTVTDSHTGARADKWICGQVPELTRSAVQKLFSDGSVIVNNKPAAKNSILKNGDTVTVFVPEPVPLEAVPENIPVDIVYQDEALLVVNKPKGMVVHPAAGNYNGTLVNALLYHCKGRLSSINGVIRPGIVHRIDKMTSGLLIVAKTDNAHTVLAEQIREHSFRREYYAVVHGHFKEQTGIIDEPVGRHRTDRKKMCVTEHNSRNAKTEYTVLEEYSRYSLIKLKLYTGRTHQIRVHMAYIGHPVLGDGVYGKSSKLCEGQCLHAKTIGFIHPGTQKYMEFNSGLPDYFNKVISVIRNG